MRARDAADLALLGTIWGGSYLLTRVGVPAFGPFAFIALRVGAGALVVAALLAWRRELGTLTERPFAQAVAGLLNSSVPFVMIAWALLHLTAGLVAIVGALSAPMTGVVARVWTGERLTWGKVAGLVAGVIGVAVLTGDRAGVTGDQFALPVTAVLGGALCYAIGGLWTKRRCAGIASTTLAAGSLGWAALAVAPLAWWTWPDAPIATSAWVIVLIVGTLCTGAAYLLYYRLIARAGPQTAILVTFLVPVTGMLWGMAMLDEPVTWRMLVGCAVILSGTAAATGMFAPRRGAVTAPAESRRT
ncbi:MAG: DMT family transporter [Burkholderiales bacterium]|jgi:drug/metabolite transporter (DMT)-like permease|nr:DMT family transporter [Burkholderiales bacterium]